MKSNELPFSEFVLLLLEYQFIVTLWLKHQSEETGNANNLYADVTYREIQEYLEHHRDVLFKKLFYENRRGNVY